MCLSTVYNENHEMLAKNVANVTAKDGKLIFTDIMGAVVAVTGTIESIDLMENFIHIRQA